MFSCWIDLLKPSIICVLLYLIYLFSLIQLLFLLHSLFCSLFLLLSSTYQAPYPVEACRLIWFFFSNRAASWLVIIRNNNSNPPSMYFPLSLLLESYLYISSLAFCSSSSQHVTQYLGHLYPHILPTYSIHSSHSLIAFLQSFQPDLPIWCTHSWSYPSL